MVPCTYLTVYVYVITAPKISVDEKEVGPVSMCLLGHENVEEDTEWLYLRSWKFKPGDDLLSSPRVLLGEF